MHWLGSSHAEIRDFPDSVKDELGQALQAAQLGLTPADARPLKGFGGAGVLELRSDSDGATYRAVYTVRFADAIYVLHVFQKKSTRGIQTPRRHLALIRERLRRVEQSHDQQAE